MLCCMLSSLKIFLEEDGSSSRYGEFSATSKISVFPPPFLQALNMFDSFAHKMLLLSIFSVKGAFIATQHSVLSNNLGNFEAAKLMPKIAQDMAWGNNDPATCNSWILLEEPHFLSCCHHTTHHAIKLMKGPGLLDCSNFGRSSLSRISPGPIAAPPRELTGRSARLEIVPFTPLPSPTPLFPAPLPRPRPRPPRAASECRTAQHGRTW